MGIFIGGVKEDFLKDDELLVIGTFNVKFALARDTAVFVGGGRIGALAAENCYLLSSGKPIIAGVVRCVNVVIVGSRNPVVIDTLRCKNVYARRLVVSKLKAGKTILGEMCIVENLVKAEKLVFTDPHTYIKKLGEISEVEFAYIVFE